MRTRKASIDDSFASENAVEEAMTVVIETDLSSITRNPKKYFGCITIDDREPWLLFGEANIRVDGRESTAWIEAHLSGNACDAEHDTAWAFKLPVIGLSLGKMGVHYSKTYFNAWVDPDAERYFHVPRPGYNPMKHPKASICDGVYDIKKHKYCKWNDKKKHVIIPEGFYVPPFDRELYEAVKGKRIEIVIGGK